MIFFCLRLSKRRPRRQLSSSPDLKQAKREARPSPPTGWGRTKRLAWGFPSPVLSTGFQKPLLWGSGLGGLF